MSLHFSSILVGISGALLVGGQTGAMAVAGLWAIGGILGLTGPLLWSLYALGCGLGLWVTVIFLRFAHRSEPFWDREGAGVEGSTTLDPARTAGSTVPTP